MQTIHSIAFYKILTLEDDSSVTDGSIDFSYSEDEGLIVLDQSENYFANQTNDCDEEITSIAFDSRQNEFLVTYKTVYAIIKLF